MLGILTPIGLDFKALFALLISCSTIMQYQYY